MKRRATKASPSTDLEITVDVWRDREEERVALGDVLIHRGQGGIYVAVGYDCDLFAASEQNQQIMAAIVRSFARELNLTWPPYGAGYWSSIPVFRSACCTHFLMTCHGNRTRTSRHGTVT